jgi:TonB family protein
MLHLRLGALESAEKAPDPLLALNWPVAVRQGQSAPDVASAAALDLPPRAPSPVWMGLIIASALHLGLLLAAMTWTQGTGGEHAPIGAAAIEVEIILEAAKEPETLAAHEAAVADLPSQILDEHPVLPEQDIPAMQSVVPKQTDVTPKPATTKPAPQGQKRSGDAAALMDAYRLAVATRIAEHKPASAMASAAQGVVIVAFNIGPDGRARQVRIVQTSGIVTLDQAAQDTISRASPFPAPPAHAPRDFTVPIRFQKK